MSTHSPEFSNADVKVLERKECHRRFLRIDLLTLQHRRFEGGWVGPVVRELMIRRPAVGVLLYDPARDEIVLVRQFRVGVLNEKDSPWLLELVAGMIEEGESEESVARRESEEEANLRPSELERICEYYCSPGTTNEKITLYCGKVDASTAGGIYGLDNEHEDIEVVTMSYAEAVAGLDSGLIDNAMTIVALQWLMLNKDRLLESWR
jgi:ADP-ribose pyrophosphatase